MSYRIFHILGTTLRRYIMYSREKKQFNSSSHITQVKTQVVKRWTPLSEYSKATFFNTRAAIAVILTDTK